MKLSPLFWPIPALLASAACVVAIRWIFRQPGEWKQPRAWFLAALIVAGGLFAWRASLRASPIGQRELLERRAGLDLPFWPRDSYYVDDERGTIVASLRLSDAQLAQVPRGSEVSRSDAESLLNDVRARDAELPTIPEQARLDATTRCRLGWYSVVVVDRQSGRLWATLFYPTGAGALPCLPD